MTYDEIRKVCAAEGLAIVAAFHPGSGDSAPPGCQTLILLGPDEPGFWQRLKNSAEYRAANPVDRWSERVIGALAARIGAEVLFPFGGPPYQPFIKWALASGQVWQSPVTLLVHSEMGLMVSFRGALALKTRIDLPAPANGAPCATCTAKPCLNACPAAALSDTGYDVAACHSYLDGAGRETCLSGGCLARRSCPVSQTYGRLREQSAHHMRAFHKG